jgi:hypothetical protein
MKIRCENFIVYLLLWMQFLRAEVSDSSLKTVDEILTFKKSGLSRITATNVQGEKEWGSKNGLPLLPQVSDEILYRDDFSDLTNWHHEGVGSLTRPESGIMQINCRGSRQGAEGCMAFCRADFPDDICVEYEMKALTTKGLLITFIAAEGRQGEDIITGLAPRTGVFKDYTDSPFLRCYHLSLSRYDDDGKHTGTSNWRRNPGFFLMAGHEDLCRQPEVWYKIAIYKKGPLLMLTVDEKDAGGFIDPQIIPDPIPCAGKVGFRTIGADVSVQIRKFKVSKLK